MPGPEIVETKFLKGPGQSPVIGMTVQNLIIGDELENWQIRERIVDVRADPPDAFDVQVQLTSQWHPAQLPAGDVRGDEHVLSTTAIVNSKLRDDHDNTYEVSQYFEKKRTGASDDTAEVVAHSAFTIKHTIVHRSSGWMYYTTKDNNKVINGASIGVGSIRFPAGDELDYVLPLRRKDLG
jgi:hypothetical protein